MCSRLHRCTWLWRRAGDRSGCTSAAHTVHTCAGKKHTLKLSITPWVSPGTTYGAQCRNLSDRKGHGALLATTWPIIRGPTEATNCLQLALRRPGYKAEQRKQSKSAYLVRKHVGAHRTVNGICKEGSGAWLRIPFHTVDVRFIAYNTNPNNSTPAKGQQALVPHPAPSRAASRNARTPAVISTQHR